MLTILSIAITITLLVLFHEIGHFMIAKLLKVKVEKFAFGFGPEWFGFTRGETHYSVNLFPMLGGYVKMHGDQPGDEKAKSPNSFLGQAWYRRVLIVIFGPIMNFVLAVLLFSTVYIVGIPVPDTGIAKIGGVYESTPAFKAGLRVGDIITKINNQPIKTWDDLTKMVQPNAGKTLVIVARRDSQEITFQAKPEYDKERKTGLLGIRAAQKLERFSPIVALGKGISETYDFTLITIKALWLMLTGKMAAEVSGPVGIVQLIGIGVKAGFASLVAFIAVLSINLGVINLFPIPVLDGGHVLFLIIEAFRGKPVSVRKMEIAQIIGLTILISLFLFATYKDIIRLMMPGPK